MKSLLLTLVSLAVVLQSGFAGNPEDQIKSRMRDMVSFLEDGDTKSFIETYFHPLVVESLKNSLSEHGNNPNGAGFQELVSQLKIAVNEDLNPELNAEGEIATFAYEENLMSVGLMKYRDEWYLIFVNS